MYLLIIGIQRVKIFTLRFGKIQERHYKTSSPIIFRNDKNI